ncbi:MAG: DUF6502 family protein [Rhodocyclaceae bacterium]|nr:DUF6502 family protein [Rhodocyclaceae bacterium]
MSSSLGPDLPPAGSANATHPSPVLIRALRRVLRPVVRLMLASGITFPLVAELLKGLFVEVAREDYSLDGKPPTDCRVNLLTAVHRKDIRRLREAGAEGEPALPDQMSFGAQLVAAWMSQEADAEGRARPLPRVAGDGEASFESLVYGQSKDLRPRVILDEWLRLGVVSMDEADRVVLNTEAFVPRAGLDEKLPFFALNLHDHLAAAADNLAGIKAPWLERCVFYDALAPQSVADLHVQARRMGGELLKGLSGTAQAMEARDAQSAEPHQRFTCGIYFYAEPTDKREKT